MIDAGTVLLPQIKAGRLRALAADIKAKLAAAGSETHYRNAENFAALVMAENDKWAAVIKKGSIRLD